jgi:hypothetical protein
MLFEAAYLSGAARPVPEGWGDPRIARYVKGWGRPGDEAVIALGDDGRRLGAAWYRLFPGRAGFVRVESRDRHWTMRLDLRS